MEVSDHLHAPAALLLGKEPRYPLHRRENILILSSHLQLYPPSGLFPEALQHFYVNLFFLHAYSVPIKLLIQSPEKY